MTTSTAALFLEPSRCTKYGAIGGISASTVSLLTYATTGALTFYAGAIFTALTALISSVAAPIFQKPFVKDPKCYKETTKGFFVDYASLSFSIITASVATASIGITSSSATIISTAAAIASNPLVAMTFSLVAAGSFVVSLAAAFAAHG